MKIKLLLLVLSFTYSVSGLAETVYKTRNAEGNIIYSDVPSEDAEELELEEAQTINIPLPKGFDNRPVTKLTPVETSYTLLEITSPENDATIRSNEGIVNINVEIKPVLDEKHMIDFLLDGKKVSSGRSLQLSLQNIDRGTHSVTVLVKNEKDKIIKQSSKLVFHLRKESKLFKNRANDNTNNPGSGGTDPTPSVESGSSPETPKIPSR